MDALPLASAMRLAVAVLLEDLPRYHCTGAMPAGPVDEGPRDVRAARAALREDLQRDDAHVRFLATVDAWLGMDRAVLARAVANHAREIAMHRGLLRDIDAAPWGRFEVLHSARERALVLALDTRRFRNEDRPAVEGVDPVLAVHVAALGLLLRGDDAITVRVVQRDFGLGIVLGEATVRTRAWEPDEDPIEEAD